MITVADFGAVGDGIADDTHAFLDTRDYILEFGGTFYVPPHFRCKITDNVDLFNITYVQMQGRIDLSPGKVISFGRNCQAVNPCGDYYFNEVAGGTLRCDGMAIGHVKLGYVTEYMNYASNDMSLTHTLTNGQIRSQKEFIAAVNFDMGHVLSYIQCGESGGWINENKYFGGGFRQILIGGKYDMSLLTNPDQVKDENHVIVGHVDNNNIFYSPWIENSKIIIANGYSNIFRECRGESNPTQNTAIFFSGTHDNLIERSLLSTSFDIYKGNELDNLAGGFNVTDYGYANRVKSFINAHINKEIIHQINGNTYNYNLGILRRHNINGDMIVNTEGYIYDSYLTKFNGFLGFTVESDADICQLIFEMYDENKTLITSQHSNVFMDGLPYLQNASEGCVFSGGAYTNASTALKKNVAFYPFSDLGQRYFRLKIKTKAASIGTQFSYLRVIKVEDIDSHTVVEPGFEFKQLFSSGVPSAGYWYAGTFVNKSNSSDGVLGWKCTAAGLPGTWKEIKSA